MQDPHTIYMSNNFSVAPQGCGVGFVRWIYIYIYYTPIYFWRDDQRLNALRTLITLQSCKRGDSQPGSSFFCELEALSKHRVDHTKPINNNLSTRLAAIENNVQTMLLSKHNRQMFQVFDCLFIVDYSYIYPNVFSPLVYHDCCPCPETKKDTNGKKILSLVANGMVIGSNRKPPQLCARKKNRHMAPGVCVNQVVLAWNMWSPVSVFLLSVFLCFCLSLFLSFSVSVFLFLSLSVSRSRCRDLSQSISQPILIDLDRSLDVKYSM